MKTFTKDEKIIARNIDKEYKWMARDRDGNLYVYEGKPKKGKRFWHYEGYDCISHFNRLFLDIKWEDEEPTRIHDIYDPQVLDDAEREYLKTVLKPFHGVVKYVSKIGNGDKEYLFILFSGDGALFFPDFDSGTMYSGMELNRKYSLDELGITYEEETDD